MSVDVNVSAVLRHRCGGRGDFAIEAKSIREIAEAINSEYPGFLESMLQPDSSIQGGVLVSVNGEMIQTNGGGETAVQSGDEIRFLSALAGG